MSDNPAPPAGPAPPLKPAAYVAKGTVIIAVLAVVTFVIALGIVGILAYLQIDGAMPVLLSMAGSTVPIFTAAVHFYIGSTQGSAKKTDLLAAAHKPPVP